jgi:hypothetical protein
MTRTIAPIRPKRPAEDEIPVPLRTPAPPLQSQPATAALDVPGFLPPACPPAASAAQPIVRDLPPSPSALLPPYADQASAIALLLHTEIQSHNITREMLHGTDQQRLEAIQRCERLQVDISSWTVAYNNLTVALHKCSEEYSRLSAEHLALRV